MAVSYGYVECPVLVLKPSPMSWFCPVWQNQGQVTEWHVQVHADSNLSVPRGLFSILYAVFSFCPASRTLSASSGKLWMSQWFSVSSQMHPLLFLTWLCVQEVETSSFAPLHPADVRERLGDLSPLPLGQVMVFPVAVLSGTAETLVKWLCSMATALTGFPPNCFLPSALNLGLEKPPMLLPLKVHALLLSPVHTLYKLFSVNPLEGPENSCQAREYTWGRFCSLRNGDKTVYLVLVRVK